MAYAGINDFGRKMTGIVTTEGERDEDIRARANAALKKELRKEDLQPSDKRKIVIKYLEIWYSKIWYSKRGLVRCIAADLKGVNLTRADLKGVNLAVANLEGANLTGADLQGANLTGADLRWARLTGADLRDADLRGANLTGADLRGANLTEADLQGADLTGADLTAADLTDASLIGANLRGANLTGADLRGADLRGAILIGCDLSTLEYHLTPEQQAQAITTTEDLKEKIDEILARSQITDNDRAMLPNLYKAAMQIGTRGYCDLSTDARISAQPELAAAAAKLFTKYPSELAEVAAELLTKYPYLRQPREFEETARAFIEPQQGGDSAAAAARALATVSGWAGKVSGSASAAADAASPRR